MLKSLLALLVEGMLQFAIKSPIYVGSEKHITSTHIARKIHVHVHYDPRLQLDREHSSRMVVLNY